MKFDIENLTGEWKEENGAKLSPVFDAVNRYRPGSMEFKIFQGEKVIYRNYLSGNVGAGPNNPPDFWFLQAHFPEKTIAAIGEVWMYFPKGFFSKTRKGKLPISFQSETVDPADKGTADMVKFSPDNQPDHMSSHTMFYTDRDENGNVISDKNLDPKRNTARIGGYIYGHGINRPNGVKGVPCPVADFVLTEEEWIGVRQVVVLNTPGFADGSLAYFFNSSQTGNEWRPKDLLFPMNGSSAVGGQVLTQNTLHWTDRALISCAGLSWFMGGGVRGRVSDGGDGPDENVSMLAKGFRFEPGVSFTEEEPTSVPNDPGDVIDVPGNDPTDAELIQSLQNQVAALTEQIANYDNEMNALKAMNIEANGTIQTLRAEREKIASVVGQVIPVLTQVSDTLNRVLADLNYAFPK